MRQYPWTCRPELRLGPYVNWWKSFNTVARLPTAHYIFPWNLLSSRETQAFCRTRVAWCIPPARKLICPGDYAPYFIMRRYIYVLPPGRKPSPWYQNKDDRTTPSPSLFSLFFFFSPLLFHSCAVSIALTSSIRIITRMQICPLDRYPRRVYPFFYPRYILRERKRIRTGDETANDIILSTIFSSRKVSSPPFENRNGLLWCNVDWAVKNKNVRVQLNDYI